MNRKRILRSWWLWAVVILFAFLFLPTLLTGGTQYHSVNTSDAIAQIQQGNVSKAIVKDKEQTVQLQLKKALNGHQKISAQYTSDYDAQITDDLIKAQAQGT